MGPVRKPIHRKFKSFAQGYEPFWFNCLTCCQPFWFNCLILELQLQPFPLKYQTFAILMLRFNLFLQSLKLPVLLSPLFLLIKNMHLLPLLCLLTHQIKKVLLSITKLSISSHKTVTELLQFLMPFYLSILWLVLLIF